MTGLAHELNDREQTILRYVVQDFIDTATPVGSRYISKRHEDALGLSSASIRNVLSDLELMGYVHHPHTSAGRMPTDMGYRFYLDRLIELARISADEEQAIRRTLDPTENPEDVLKECSRLLGKISHQLCIVTAPELSSGIFEKLELVQVMPSRIMVIISIKSGLVRTIMMDVGSEFPRDKLDELSRFLNERLSGLTIKQIRESFVERVRDRSSDDTGLIQLFIDSVDKLFVTPAVARYHVGGAEQIIEQPEFMNPRDFRSVIELINDQEILVHVLRKHDTGKDEVRVTIGREHEDGKLEPYSVITARYSIGDVTGSIGVLGPKRMPYDRMIPLVDFVARTVSDMFAPPK